jgi:cbb3-type cytochrome oxidase subunit 3
MVVGIIIAFVTCFLVLITVWALCRECRHRRARAAAAAADTPQPPSPEHDSGHVEERPLRKACAASPTAGLPVFMYSPSVKHNLAGGGEETATCSVCLGAFELGETVRLLPACLHLYHAECIEPWLEAHSTCPICRSDTDPTSTGTGRLPHV